jgi:hypothetical protein
MKILLAAFTIDNTAFAAIGALAGVIFTLIFGCLRDYWTRKAEKERHIRELAVKAAIAQWKEERTSASAFNLANPAAPKKTVKSLRLRIASFLKFSEVLSEKPVTSDTISRNVIASNTVISEAEKKIKDNAG